MSADSPKRGGVHKGTQVVSPQPIVDRSIIDSVAGIINDIVPQAYATPNSDNKESISWARFEYADINDPSVYPDYNEGSNIPPLLLVLGYSTGVQVWLISATGEATEVLSWRQGVVRTLRILPNPKTDDKCIDLFEPKRPMVAICDSAGPGPQFCNVSFISLKTGEQTKNIKFKNPVCDILANRRSIVVTFLEKIAVFDARSLEDVLTVTTCYASPGPNPNPVALGTRWLAYSEKILLPTRRSSGGCEGEGVQSYTATVLYAAKSLGKGLRGLGETVASSLTGNSVSTMTINNMGNDVTHPGVITILDLQVAKEEKDTDDDANVETVIAHFTAHTEAIVAMTFDLTGALLMTADKRGHDFHVFRIQPHPDGPTLAAVHHLYILHRGDTTAKVQDMTFSSDTRWAAVSTVRGTTHVFPVAPYGGPVGVRTHSTPHVVNRLSRFHRSAGLTDDSTRSHSPVSHTELPYPVYPYTNPRLPPYPHPTILHPLAQIRQPSSLNHANSQTQPRHPQRQRLHSDDSGTLPLKICACFAPPRAWIYAQREASSKIVKRAVDSLFIMACHGNMIQYDLEPKPAAGIPKEKVCDDTIIELEVEAKGQWPLLRSPNSLEIVPPLSMTSPFLSISTVLKNAQPLDSTEDRWLSQVEIVTHAGPHRRLWMGPQFVFKTYNAPSGVAVNLVEAEAVEIGVTGGSRPARSNPVNMPHAASRPLMPIVIDGSGSSYEQSPRFMEAYGDALDSENVGIGSGENQLREDLAEAMLETSIAPHRAPGRRSVFERVGQPVTKVVNPLGTVITVSADEEDVSSSQEFDSAEEGLVPEPPRSVCAEEGPASLGDLNLEPESQTLRDLTEICAEMRSASEPAIDSVPDESIREVKERKTLCAEMAALITTRHCSIDFEKEEAFRDVPSSLSLCAEQGEIPSSPMTQAKENAWCKKAIKYDETKAHEKNYAKAKYVVSYDEDSVVLVENKISCDRGGVRVQSKDERCISRSAQDSSRQAYVVRKSPEFKKPSKSSGKYAPSNDSVVSKENQIYIDKYSIKEHEDSIIIEDTSQYRDTKSNYMKRKVSNIKEERSVDSGETSTNKEFQRLPKESFDAPKYKQKAKMSRTHARSKNSETKSEEAEGCNEAVESFVELKVQEALVDDDVCKEGKAPVEDARAVVTVIKDCILSNLEPLPLDDFSSIEYHMVETNFHNKETTSSNQSDENIEHIQSSEITRICQFDHDVNPDKSTEAPTYSESSPTAQRKSSKSTISDDDLEYIHSSELAEALDKCNNSEKSFGTEDYNDRLLTMRTQSKHKLSSDDDLEHTQCSDICVIEPEISATEIDSSEKSYASIMKSQEASIEQVCKVKRSRKPKDIVVIESDTSEPEVTVIVHPQESRARCKTPEKDTSEEIDKYTASKDIPVDYKVHQNILEKVKVRNPKIASSALLPKRSNLNAIEIIDIDAMQKAELETATESTSTPECKILTPRHEITGTRSRKSRKNRKVHSEAVVQDTVVAEPVASFQSSKIYMTELQEAAEELLINSKWQEQKISTPALEVSWSAIVKKKSNPPSETVPRKESNLEPVIEVGKKSKCEDTKKLDPTIKESEFHGLDHFFDTLEMKSNLEATKMAACSKKVCESAVTSDPIIIDFLASLINSTDDKIQSHDSSSVVSAVESKTDKILGGGSLDGNKISQIDRSTSRAASVSSKENSPEIERDPEPEKKSDSEQEIMPERSSSSDELNANIMHMDVEDDCPVREIVEKGTISGTTSFLSSGVKKGNRSKKKKRR